MQKNNDSEDRYQDERRGSVRAEGQDETQGPRRVKSTRYTTPGRERSQTRVASARNNGFEDDYRDERPEYVDGDGEDKDEVRGPKQSNSNRDSGYDEPVGEDEEPEFVEQDPEWFVAGRYFSVEARDSSKNCDDGLEGKEFVLLDWDVRQREGEAVRVDMIPKRKWTSGMHTRMMAIMPPTPSGTTSKPGVAQVFLDELGGNADVPSHRYVRFDMKRQVAFNRYPCKDLGFLRKDSLDQLRLGYTTYLNEHRWSLQSSMTAQGYSPATILSPATEESFVNGDPSIDGRSKMSSRNRHSVN
jgi:hypothetical protein